ncbi:Lysophospholipid acyltransferase LPEAT1 [Platanthera guangdongensis]|uniref:Lysophospholipid acyltransferase LPEAT1 n=1 Tax=Platanthera guangdongensis TaxID=2320717 RepID=A0ABR2M9Y2_9ASPA
MATVSGRTREVGVRWKKRCGYLLEEIGRHVILLLCQFINHIEVIRFPIYYPSEQEKEDPKLYACNVRKLMASEGNLIFSDIGLPEKRVYHAALNGNSLPCVLHQKDE